MVSYAQVDASTVKFACLSYITEIEQKLEADELDLIVPLMMRRFFPAETKEEAIDKLKHSREWMMTQYNAEVKIARISALLRLCDLAKDHVVFLSAADVNILRNHLPSFA